MTGRPHRLAGVPPLLVGASAAIAAEVAVALLLYTGPGLVRSLTAILAVEGAALGIGLWSATRPGPDLVDGLRRRWLLCLASFLAAAVFGAAWSLSPGMAEGRLGQGLGLAILAALPLFAAGGVLGGMASVSAGDSGGPRPGTGAAAFLGAGVGFVLTGLLLPRAPMPASILLACLVMLSLAGMVFGAVLSGRVEIQVRARSGVGGGDVRVEDRILGSGVGSTRVMLEGVHPRRRLSLDDEVEVPWDVALARALMPDGERPWRLLLVGGGVSAVARSVRREHPTGRVDVMERIGAVVELGHEHFGTELTVGEGERVTVTVGNFEDLLAAVRGVYDAVLVDTSSLAPIGGFGGLSRTARARLVRSVAEPGVLAWGPGPPQADMPEALEGWSRVVFQRAPRNGAAGDPGADEIVVAVRDGRTVLPTSLQGFVTRSPARAEP